MLSPPSPTLTRPSPLSVHFHRGPAGQNKAATLCSPSSLSPDSCRLLTSSTWRQWREGGTGADWCLPVCQWRFLPLGPLPFFLSFLSSSLDKAAYSKLQRPLLAFPVTHRQCGDRPAIYSWVDMRTRCDAMRERRGGENEKRARGVSVRTRWSGISAKASFSEGLIPSFCHMS